MSLELPRPLPLEFTPRQMHYLLQLVAFDASRGIYCGDDTSQAVIQSTHAKLLLVQRAYFDDLEKLQAEIEAAP
jgi:hypothetical protein